MLYAQEDTLLANLPMEEYVLQTEEGLISRDERDALRRNE